MSTVAEIAAQSDNPLDLFSISQTKRVRSSEVQTCAALQKCKNGAPFFALKKTEKSYSVMQGNCHDWTCPRCGQARARREYGRMVEGARKLAQDGHELYFLTLTCRGKEMSLETAENGFLKWTNRFLTAARTRAKRSGGFFAYAGVTERQKRGHPHSHYLTTWKPHDLEAGTKDHWRHIAGRLVCEQRPALRSEWTRKQCVRSGLGDQYDISRVREPEAVSRYLGKYLFKTTAFERWPKNWRRVRYSQNWPQLPETDSEAFALVKDSDWQKLAALAAVVRPADEASADMAALMLPRYGDVLIKQR